MTATQLQNSPQAGDTAPDFVAPSTSGKEVSLSSFRGKRDVLIAFFPLAFTGTCTKELICFTEDFDQFTGKGVEILPISVDSTASLREFKNKLQMKTELLSDFRRDISRSYGVLNEARFYSRRAYFLIDREGVVRWAHVEANASERRENSEILGAIAQLAYGPSQVVSPILEALTSPPGPPNPFYSDAAVYACSAVTSGGQNRV